MGKHLYCGDQRVDMPFETCDDGNTKDGDGCDSDCKTEAEEDAGAAGGNAGSASPSGAAGVAGGLTTPRQTPTGTRPDATQAAGTRGASNTGKRDDGGCGCRLQPRITDPAAEQSSRPGGVWLLLAGLLGALALRRRR
jgi:MYXO-CTERM domain-containing protein